MVVTRPAPAKNAIVRRHRRTYEDGRRVGGGENPEFVVGPLRREWSSGQSSIRPPDPGRLSSSMWPPALLTQQRGDGRDGDGTYDKGIQQQPATDDEPRLDHHAD